MKELLCFLTLMFLPGYFALAQTVIINPDGTPTIVLHNGSTSTVINPDGTLSTVLHSGTSSTIVHPNGTLSTVLHSGGSSTVVHPNGTLSTVLHNGGSSTVIHPDGTLSTVLHDGSASTVSTAIHAAGGHAVVRTTTTTNCEGFLPSSVSDSTAIDGTDRYEAEPHQCDR